MANIQINSVPTRVQYTASGGQTVFSYTFPIKADADLKVYQRGSADSPDDSADLLTLTTDYTVTGANTASGGTIVLVVAATANDIVTIVGDKAIDRTAIYDQSVTLKKADLNNDFNNTVMYEKQTETIQNQLTPKYARSELISPGVREDNLILPILNDGYLWVGRGNYGDTPDDIIAMSVDDLMPLGLVDATFIVQTPDASLPNAQALDALVDGIMVNDSGVVLTATLTGTADQVSVTNGTGVSGNPVFALADNLRMPGTEGFVWVTGTTAQRPGVPALGEARWNSDTSEWEGWDGVSWVNFVDSGGTVINSSYVTLADESGDLPSSFSLGSLTTGLVKNTVALGVSTLSTAVANTDYIAPSGGTMTGDLILNADPTVALGAATKQYVDNIALGIDIKEPVYASTTATLTATYANGALGVGATLTNSGALAAFSTDGVSPAINSRILVKNQASTFENGIYTLTTVGSGAVAWVLTRATDYDVAGDIATGDLIIVENGTTNASTGWLQTATVATMGTDPITFTKFAPEIGANAALSNLSAVAINTSLTSDTDITDDLGTLAIRWNNIFAQALNTGDTVGDTLKLRGYDVDGATYVDFLTITAGNTPTCVLNGDITTTTQSFGDSSTKIATTAFVQAAREQIVNGQTAGYTAVAGDLAKVIRYTGAGGVTLALTAAATLTDGWFTTLRNDSSGTITINPDAAETINGAATLDVSAGNAVIIYTNGTLFYTVGSNTGGSFTAASQAEMETASSTTVGVTPGRQQYHPSAPKVWGKVEYSGGVPTLQSPSYNMTSITDTATGRLTLTFDVDFSSGDYATTVTNSAVASTQILAVGCEATPAAGSCILAMVNSATAALVDPTNGAGGISWIICGDQA